MYADIIYLTMLAMATFAIIVPAVTTKPLVGLISSSFSLIKSFLSLFNFSPVANERQSANNTVHITSLPHGICGRPVSECSKCNNCIKLNEDKMKLELDLEDSRALYKAGMTEAFRTEDELRKTEAGLREYVAQLEEDVLIGDVWMKDRDKVLEELNITKDSYEVILDLREEISTMKMQSARELADVKIKAAQDLDTAKNQAEREVAMVKQQAEWDIENVKQQAAHEIEVFKKTKGYISDEMKYRINIAYYKYEAELRCNPNSKCISVGRVSPPEEARPVAVPEPATSETTPVHVPAAEPEPAETPACPVSVLDSVEVMPVASLSASPESERVVSSSDEEGNEEDVEEDSEDYDDDDEGEWEDGSEEEEDDEDEPVAPSSAAAAAAEQNRGLSLFDRITLGADGKPLRAALSSQED